MGASNSKTGPCPGSGVDRNVVGGIDGRGRSRPGKISSVFCGCSSSSSSRNPPAEMGHPPPEHSDNSVELSRLTVAKTEKPQEHIPREGNCESNSEFSASEIKDSAESSDDNHEEHWMR
ncbi:hypothetical protein MLD38_014860 [Melastoma candidum]|uniref:Uncharacterized protein n=1 Tax=Melastoma candidum TaxID=119954 RepID=A0ACB9RE93_9MYRT|nr:hypothetical protein MLD38_014860 [Melastoma candidum]